MVKHHRISTAANQVSLQPRGMIKGGMTTPPQPSAQSRRNLALPDLAATSLLARRLGPLLRAGDVVALHGQLGAGKTAFARALIQGLQEDPEEVPSPTFSLVQQYKIGALCLWHFDLYRISSPAEAYELGIEEAFAEGISLIEWPENLGGLLPPGRLDIYLSLPPGAGFDGTLRLVRMEAHGNWRSRLSHA